MVWECARCTTPVQFQASMQKLKTMNEKAWEYLAGTPASAWTRAYFTDFTKVDTLCNNSCEVFNAKIVKYRGKSIITMAEEIRGYILRTMINNRKILTSYQGKVVPIQQKRLEKEKMAGSKWNLTWCGDGHGHRFEVSRWDVKVDVNITERTCTCRLWQLTGLPCRHACAAMLYLNLKPEDYVDELLTMDKYNATYQHFISPVVSNHYWEGTNQIGPAPPLIPKKKPGRPKTNRRKYVTDNIATTDGRMARKTLPMHCRRCGKEGHNTRTCPLPRLDPQPEAPEAAAKHMYNLWNLGGPSG